MADIVGGGVFCCPRVVCRAQKIEQAMKDMPKKVEEYYRVRQSTTAQPHLAHSLTHSSLTHSLHQLAHRCTAEAAKLTAAPIVLCFVTLLLFRCSVVCVDTTRS